MSKPKFEIDDAVKVDGRPGVVFYVEKRSEAPRSVWVYTLRNINGETVNAIEPALTKATLLEEKAIKAKTVCFGQALEALKMGKKVFREAWTGRILWAWLGSITSNRFFVKLADLTISDYTMSYKDILACDWVIMVEEEKRPYPDRIPVPENIKFYRFMGQTYLLVSPNGKLILGQANGFPSAGSLDYQSFAIPASRKAYLIPCKRSDLKPGDIGFREHPSIKPKADHVSQYSVILNDTDYAFWKNEMDMHIGDLTEDFAAVQWYKVIFE